MRAAGVHLHTQGPGTGENAFKKAQLLKVCCDMDRHDGTRHQTNAPLFTQQNYKSAMCARCVCDATRATSSDGDDQSAQQSRIKRAPSKDDRCCCCCCCQTDRACAQSARSRTAHFLLCVLPGQQQHLGNTRTHTHTHWHPFQAATAPPATCCVAIGCAAHGCPVAVGISNIAHAKRTQFVCVRCTNDTVSI